MAIGQIKTAAKRRGSGDTLFWIVLVLVLAGAAAVRFPGLNARELWFDENCTFYIVHNLYDWPADGPDQWREVAHLPYFAALHAWTRLAGETIWGMRSFSALVGCIGVAALGLVGRRIAGTGVGLAVAALAACSPIHVHYSQEARGYTFWLLLVTVGVYLICRAAQTMRARWWTAYAGCVWVTVLTHYFAILWPIGTLAGAWLACDRRRFLRQWVVTHVVLGIALAPVVLLLVLPLADGGSKPWFREVWAGYPPALAVLKSLWAMLPSGGYPDYLGAVATGADAAAARLGPGWKFAALWGSVIVVAAMALMVASTRDRHSSNTDASDSDASLSRRGLLAVMISLSVVYLLASLLHSCLFEPTYVVGRYDLAAWPSLVLAVALLIEATSARIARSRLGRCSIGVAFTALLGGCGAITLYGAQLAPVSNPLTDRARQIAGFVAPKDLVISLGKYKLFVTYEWHRIGFSAEVISFPTCHDRQLCWDDADAELADPETLHRDAVAVTARVDEALAAGRDVWLLAHGKPAGARWEVDRQLFAHFAKQGLSVIPLDDKLGLAAIVRIVVAPTRDQDQTEVSPTVSRTR